MEPVQDYSWIETMERQNGFQHAVLLLFVKPSDEQSDILIQQFNYYHFASGHYCSIYAPGYHCGPFPPKYTDAKRICSVNGMDWWYSDRCFVEFQQQLSTRIKWVYGGEPEVLIFQTAKGEHSSFDFSNYVAIDLCQGLRRGYIDSIPRLMESLINASKHEVEAKQVLNEAKKISPKEIAKMALELTLELTSCPESIKTMLADRVFYRSANRKE